MNEAVQEILARAAQPAAGFIPVNGNGDTHPDIVAFNDKVLAEEIERLRAELAKAYAAASSLSDELVRVRTAGHGAAHELDNIAVESGLGHSPAPGVVAGYVRGLRNKADRLDRLCD